MIKVIVGTVTQRKEALYPGATTVREILEDQEIDYSVAQIMMDGVNVGIGDMDKSLSTLGVTEKCMLMAIVKSNNARK
jgi:hypothetical protein